MKVTREPGPLGGVASGSGDKVLSRSTTRLCGMRVESTCCAHRRANANRMSPHPRAQALHPRGAGVAMCAVRGPEHTGETPGPRQNTVSSTATHTPASNKRKPRRKPGLSSGCSRVAPLSQERASCPRGAGWGLEPRPVVLSPLHSALPPARPGQGALQHGLSAGSQGLSCHQNPPSHAPGWETGPKSDIGPCYCSSAPCLPPTTQGAPRGP